jgi:hypothetical protein
MKPGIAYPATRWLLRALASDFLARLTIPDNDLHRRQRNASCHKPIASIKDAIATRARKPPPHGVQEYTYGESERTLRGQTGGFGRNPGQASKQGETQKEDKPSYPEGVGE